MKEKEGKRHGEGTYINKNLCKLSKESEEKKDLLTNVRLAKPTPGFCIRSEKYSIKYPAQRKKVFINIKYNWGFGQIPNLQSPIPKSPLFK